MNAEVLQERDVTMFYKTKGILINFSGEKAIVQLERGIVVLVPAYCVKMNGNVDN